MGSINAENVAKDVSETIRKGEKVILGEIIKENGYSESTSKKPKLVTETKSYQETINPIVKRWEKERERLTSELEKRDLTGERYETVMKAIDIATKNIQLLSGGKTENIGLGEGFNEEEKEALLALIKNDNKTSP